jgi:hypothetical protein
MPQGKLMTLDEKLDTGIKAIELKKQGKIEEAERLNRTIPPPPFLQNSSKTMSVLMPC